MVHSALMLAAWITTGTAGMIVGMVAVGLAKRRLSAPQTESPVENPVSA